MKKRLKLIESKIEKIEKEIESKDQSSVHSPASTVTVSSPENYNNFEEMIQVGNSFQTYSPMKPPPTSLVLNSSTSITAVNSVGTLLTHSNSTNQIPGPLPQRPVAVQTQLVSPNPGFSFTAPSNFSSPDPSVFARILVSKKESDESLKHPNQERVSMSFDYLPAGLPDNKLKLVIASHFKDLQCARRLLCNL